MAETLVSDRTEIEIEWQFTRDYDFDFDEPVFYAHAYIGGAHTSMRVFPDREPSGKRVRVGREAVLLMDVMGPDGKASVPERVVEAAL